MSIEKEKITIDKMIRIYCKDHHHTKGKLCTSCFEIRAYAFEKLENCPLKEKKPSCKKCSIHCYMNDKREEIKIIMRYAGPKMMMNYPLDFIRHLFR